MTYVVTESYIKCKYMNCMTPSPVDHFHEGANSLVIDPDECIDCDACPPVCPANAIKPDSEPDLERWLKINADFAKRWLRMRKKKNPPADASDWASVSNKFDKHLPKSENGQQRMIHTLKRRTHPALDRTKEIGPPQGRGRSDHVDR